MTKTTLIVHKLKDELDIDDYDYITCSDDLVVYKIIGIKNQLHNNDTTLINAQYYCGIFELSDDEYELLIPTEAKIYEESE